MMTIALVATISSGGLLWSLLRWRREGRDWKKRALVLQDVVNKTWPNARSLADCVLPAQHPYRSPDDSVRPPEPDRRESESLVIDWDAGLFSSISGDSKLGSRCPRCTRSWWLVEKCCECDLTDAPHFHRACNADGGRNPIGTAGCGARWIMRSKDAPPLTRGDKNHG